MFSVMSDRRDLVWLRAVIPGAGLCIITLTVVQALSSILGVGYAVCLRNIVDSAVAGTQSALLQSVLLFAGLILCQFLIQIISRYLGEYTRSKVENQLKLHLFETLLHKNYGEVTAVHSGEWMNRLTSDTVVVANAAVGILPGAAGMIARMGASAWLLLHMVPKLTTILIIGGLCMIASTLWMRKWMKRLHRKIQESDGRLRIFLTERLGSLMILKSYQQEDSACLDADALMTQHRSSRMRKNRFSNICNSGFALVLNSTFALGAAYCGYGILHGTVSYGTFMAVIQLVGQLQSPIAGITGVVPQYYAMLASTERLMAAEDYAADSAVPLSKEDAARFQGFGVRDLSYAYTTDKGQRQALSGLNIHVDRGEYVAFSGPSGCGKSTVLKLLLCLFEPDAGQKYVQTDKGEEPLTKAWSRLFAYVPQGNHLMSGTIRDVVAFAHSEAAYSDAEIWKALDAACAREFVEALPDGLDTVLGERGSGLSEGQMQRLAVARALFSNRPVLLLDEATSALDEDSEVRLLQNLRSLTGKTVIIVTHRPAALEVVDKVVRFSES